MHSQTIIILIVCICLAMDGYLLWVDELPQFTLIDPAYAASIQPNIIGLAG